MNKKILLIGPLPDPVTGESFANQTILENITKYSHAYSINSINMSYHKLENLGKFSLKKVFFYGKLYKNIFRILNADIVYITPGQTFFGVLKYAPFILFSKILGKKIIVHIHGNYLHVEYKNAPPWKKRIIYFILSMANKGIVLSGLMRENMKPFVGNNNVHELNNFAGDDLFSREKGEEDIHTDQLRLLYLSNLIPEKGIFDTLEALLILKNNRIKYSAKIAGSVDARNKEKILEYLNKLGGNTEYLGIIRGKEKREALMQSNIFIFPTYYRIEGQPICILEAMATANIILTTNHAGIPDIFIPGINGFYIDKKSPENIADKLTELSDKLQNYTHIMSYNREIAAKKYRIKTFMHNFIKIIES